MLTVSAANNKYTSLSVRLPVIVPNSCERESPSKWTSPLWKAGASEPTKNLTVQYELSHGTVSHYFFFLSKGVQCFFIVSNNVNIQLLGSSLAAGIYIDVTLVLLAFTFNEQKVHFLE